MPTIIASKISDKPSTFSQLQIEFDSPNLFTVEISVSRIQYVILTHLYVTFNIYFLLYLSGWSVCPTRAGVLPLHPGLIPPYCTLEAALADLVADARFYQLNGLLIIRYAEIVGDYMTKPNQFEHSRLNLQASPIEY
ncbi:hypothetical protein AG1IA_10087 [Rhizoctonia solani AG-1 IA]|uniref:Uncharacterized protein n=1 Tax=Thanatephorus cucumeris (strain AG1-IA) TaxID=983506 RepID=L8WGH7_THACA|nr:hypothetical protein AG1IA_10087 [Rhizoctonia solani AG-1 IA]